MSRDCDPVSASFSRSGPLRASYPQTVRRCPLRFRVAQLQQAQKSGSVLGGPWPGLYGNHRDRLAGQRDRFRARQRVGPDQREHGGVFRYGGTEQFRERLSGHGHHGGGITSDPGGFVSGLRRRQKIEEFFVDDEE
ncbi:hypothetical protein [Streptomyces sp. LN245]|uniref:hypothetical protein n=1 Tax=Streptomyces sp. LN245 TaxID=3112975 RepID=UPI003721B1B9